MSPGIGVGVGLPFVHLQRRGGGENALTYSEDATQWTGTGTVTGDQATAPDSTLTADLYTVAASTNFKYPDLISTEEGVQWCWSLYIKGAGAAATPTLWIRETNTGSFQRCQFAFDAGGTLTGATPQGSPDDYGFSDEGSGWYRCWMSWTMPATANEVQPQIRVTAGAYPASVYVWGAQLEVGDSPTAYKPKGVP